MFKSGYEVGGEIIMNTELLNRLQNELAKTKHRIAGEDIRDILVSDDYVVDYASKLVISTDGRYLADIDNQ